VAGIEIAPERFRREGMRVVTTTHCVEGTVRDAYQKDYDVIVPAEAVDALDSTAHDVTGVLGLPGYG
jgi:nicotinamidase-related amidase